jgi:peptidyl-prolyl cis-trans isomerase SurA
MRQTARALHCLIVIAVVGLSAPPCRIGAEVLEEPIAIVGDRIILRSEWEAQTSLYAMQAKRDLSDPATRDTIGQMMLDQLINDQLILIVAEKDTTLKIPPSAIDAALEDHIADMRRRFSTEDEFRAALVREGLSERDLRVRFRRDVENQLLKQRLIQKKLSEVNVSNGEVREFYNKFRDSLPEQPAAIKLAHVLMSVEVTAATTEQARTRITQVLSEIQGGLDFAEAAKKYSEDPTAPTGGDLGWVAKGDLVGPFEDAAFQLTTGQVSGVVRTDIGLHLIQCLEKGKDRVRVRHIFFSLSPTAADTSAVVMRADSVAIAARDSADFCGLAQSYSKDEESRKNCGELGWYPIDEMFPEFKAALENSVAGDIVGPVKTQFGWHVLRVLERRSRKTLDINEDWDRIKDIARQDKTNLAVTEWLAEIRKDTYVEIRPLSASVTVESGGP